MPLGKNNYGERGKYGIGVSYDPKPSGLNFKARLHCSGKVLFVGRFSDVQEARDAYDLAHHILEPLTRSKRTNSELPASEFTYTNADVEAKARAFLEAEAKAKQEAAAAQAKETAATAETIAELQAVIAAQQQRGGGVSPAAFAAAARGTSGQPLSSQAAAIAAANAALLAAAGVRPPRAVRTPARFQAPAEAGSGVAAAAADAPEEGAAGESEAPTDDEAAEAAAGLKRLAEAAAADEHERLRPARKRRGSSRGLERGTRASQPSGPGDAPPRFSGRGRDQKRQGGAPEQQPNLLPLLLQQQLGPAPGGLGSPSGWDGPSLVLSPAIHSLGAAGHMPPPESPGCLPPPRPLPHPRPIALQPRTATHGSHAGQQLAAAALMPGQLAPLAGAAAAPALGAAPGAGAGCRPPPALAELAPMFLGRRASGGSFESSHSQLSPGSADSPTEPPSVRGPGGAALPGLGALQDGRLPGSPRAIAAAAVAALGALAAAEQQAARAPGEAAAPAQGGQRQRQRAPPPQPQQRQQPQQQQQQQDGLAELASAASDEAASLTAEPERLTPPAAGPPGARPAVAAAAAAAAALDALAAAAPGAAQQLAGGGSGSSGGGSGDLKQQLLEMVCLTLLAVSQSEAGKAQ